jgi:sigma-B regulation protein RsbU (phosphoserine phosphatase)
VTAPPIHDGAILVVDDTGFDRDLVRSILREAGFTRVETAADGAAALERVRRAPPDMLLLDLVMPAPDGFAVLAALRADSRLARLPVLVLTALDSPDQRDRAFEAGATDFVTKPVEPIELVARVRIQLEYRALAMALQASLDRRRDELDVARETMPDLQPDPGPAMACAAEIGAVLAVRAGQDGMLSGEAWGAVPIEDGVAAYRLVSRDGVVGALALHRLAADTLAEGGDPGTWLGAIGRSVPELLGPGAVVAGTCAQLRRGDASGAVRLAWAAAGRVGAWTGGGTRPLLAAPPVGPLLGSCPADYAAGLVGLAPGALAALGPPSLAPGPAAALLSGGDADRALAGLAGMAARTLGDPMAARASILVLGRRK